MRRDFHLPEFDEQYLSGGGLPWETIQDGQQRCLLVHDRPLHPGYNHPKVTALLLIPAAYPDAALDMVFFRPHLQRVDGESIPAISLHNHVGQQWQRWSRHYTSVNPWRIGVDDISTHLTLVDHWLKREFDR